KKLLHLVIRLEIKLVCREAHAIGVVNGGICRDTHKDFLSRSVLGADIVGVVSRNEAHSRLTCKLIQIRKYISFIRELMVLNLYIIILTAYRLISKDSIFRGLVVALREPP